MRGRTFGLTGLWALAIIWLGGVPCEGQVAEGTPKAFVENFYNWYLPIARSDDIGRASDVAIKVRAQDFGLTLARLLKKDSDAQDRCRELVSLDFDPFLNSQDPAERYLVGTVMRKGHVYRADVYSVHDHVQSKSPDVVAEFVKKNGRFFFVNFRYAGGDLLNILKMPETCSVPHH